MTQARTGETAMFYRRQAADCRRQADSAPDAPGRCSCLCLARHYEHQARLLEIEALKLASPNIAVLRRSVAS
ncbi:MAG TPA: hypothetical protein VH331_16605 [Allosphingosinicella sp.]|nr:hypothetical protein [Allosphingosinicella sp.]